MMRVLFVTVAAPTHLQAQVPLAWAFRSGGHDVCVASQPDLLEHITHAGLTAVSVGEALNLGEWLPETEPQSAKAGQDDADARDDYIWARDDYIWARDDYIWDSQGGVPWELLDFCELRPEKLTYEYMHGVFSAWTALDFQFSSSARMIDDLVQFAREWRPDLVVWDSLTFAGSVAAMATGAAHARLMFGLDVIARMRESYLAVLRLRPPELREDPIQEWLEPVLAQYGGEFSEEAVVGQWTIDPVPSSMRLLVDHHYVPVRYVPYNGHATIPGWLRAAPKRRRVCLTLGRSFREVMGGDRMSIGNLLAAVSDVDIEVVATLNDDQLAALPQVPDNVHPVDFVPLDALLPSCSAIIHHSGSGTSQTALAHGVPQVIVPANMLDNLLKAQRVEEAGVGLYVRDVDRLSAGELRSMLVRVLDEPSFAENAARVRREMLGTPAPRDIVPVLERLTAEHRSGNR